MTFNSFLMIFVAFFLGVILIMPEKEENNQDIVYIVFINGEIGNSLISICSPSPCLPYSF